MYPYATSLVVAKELQHNAYPPFAIVSFGRQKSTRTRRIFSSEGVSLCNGIGLQFPLGDTVLEEITFFFRVHSSRVFFNRWYTSSGDLRVGWLSFGGHSEMLFEHKVQLHLFRKTSKKWIVKNTCCCFKDCRQPSHEWG